VVLARMRDNGYITRREFEAAAQAPLTVAPRQIRPSQAPYFVDLVNNRIRSRFQPGAVQDVYTTLDLDLQRAASAAVEDGMARLDARLKKQRGAATPLPEVALVAIDPQTGAVKALIGGRYYASSQLNRALAERQPGSAFKPFVYAAAFNTGLAGGPNVLTPASIVDDEPTTFVFGDETYAPENFKGVVYGPVTLRTALEKSINVATVMVAQQTGYGRVAALARAAGLTNTRPTPALALGSYDATPLALAGAYTVFANAGTYVEPELIAAARTSGGDAVYRAAPRQRPVLDPRVAWLVGNLMQGVIQEGTGAGVRAGGFTAPAAGKTGTSKDGWFAGFTSKLLCVVWVGFDDGHDLDVEGARSALPIWTGFMKRALSLRRYADPQPFAPPDGIAAAQIDPDSGQLATIFCPSVRTEYFLEGTAPQTYCTLHQPRWTVTLPPALPAGGPAGPPAVAVPTVR
jgi:penicillin-binding protein 1B